MAWIESHQDLGQHPKTFALADALAADIPTAIGLLHLLWHFALKFAWRDGDLAKFPANAIAKSIGWTKDPDELIKAFQSTGWLDGMVIHDWLDYAGKIVRDRTYNQERRITALSGDIVRKSLATVPDLTVPNITKPKDIPAAARVFDFELIWAMYPKRLGRKQAMKHFQASVRSEEDWQAIQQAMTKYVTHIKKTGVEQQFIQHGSTWFNNWRDWTNFQEGKNGTNVGTSIPTYVAIAEEARRNRTTTGFRKIASPREILTGIRDIAVDKRELPDDHNRESERRGTEPNGCPVEKV